MNAWKWAAVVVVGWTGIATVVGVCTGRFISDWRDYCADHAAKQHTFQQFEVEPRYVDAEIARIEAEMQP